ncbi:MAG TPA: hypothetical protein VMB22_05325 [Verrucomicrobiae bacterium]|nr:hypothetical protein [Verrucomicrobiae bacterium]
MKRNTKIIAVVAGIASLAALTLVAGPVVIIRAPLPPPPVVISPPVVTIGVPDDYVWDGYEYVGVVGDQYYYLGPGNVWIVCNPVRLARFQDWVKIHPDWRTHATVNVRFRLDAKGHEHPWHGGQNDKHGH